MEGKGLVYQYLNEDCYRVYFFYRPEKFVKNVHLHCGATGDNLTQLKKLSHGNYYAVSLDLPAKLRTLYSFVLNVDADLLPKLPGEVKTSLEEKIAALTKFKTINAT